ncbi:MAG: response regulator [Planctomycetes bacterium]|nr:response regulator [Planctomycetota bacterium]MBL7038380.1 response regulator [Pirellulaceae bacterium]
MPYREPQILLVEDDCVFREIARFRLQNAGIQVTVAADGRRAWELAQRIDFDVVITGNRLPGMSGIELCRRFRQEERLAGVPLMLMTAEPEGPHLSQVRAELGLTEVFAKPFVLTDMVAAIEVAMQTGRGHSCTGSPDRSRGGSNQRPAESKKSNRVMIVDDCPTSRDMLTMIFRKDYKLAAATDGLECLTLLDDFRPNVVLLDIVMPAVDGYEVCNRIKSSVAGDFIQVILVSAKGSTEERLQGYKAGADDYVVKPFDPHELRSKVQVHCRLSKVCEELLMANTKLERYDQRDSGPCVNDNC